MIKHNSTGDVLYIFDSCHSGFLALEPGPKLLASSAWDSEAGGDFANTFAKAFIEVLRSLDGRPATVSSIFTAIHRNTKHNLKYPPVHVAKEGAESIVLQSLWSVSKKPVHLLLSMPTNPARRPASKSKNRAQRFMSIPTEFDRSIMSIPTEQLHTTIRGHNGKMNTGSFDKFFWLSLIGVFAFLAGFYSRGSWFSREHAFYINFCRPLILSYVHFFTRSGENSFTGWQTSVDWEEQTDGHVRWRQAPFYTSQWCSIIRCIIMSAVGYWLW